MNERNEKKEREREEIMEQTELQGWQEIRRAPFYSEAGPTDGTVGLASR